VYRVEGQGTWHVLLCWLYQHLLLWGGLRWYWVSGYDGVWFTACCACWAKATERARCAACCQLLLLQLRQYSHSQQRKAVALYGYEVYCCQYVVRPTSCGGTAASTTESAWCGACSMSNGKSKSALLTYLRQLALRVQFVRHSDRNELRPKLTAVAFVMSRYLVRPIATSRRHVSILHRPALQQASEWHSVCPQSVSPH